MIFWLSSHVCVSMGKHMCMRVNVMYPVWSAGKGMSFIVGSQFTQVDRSQEAFLTINLKYMGMHDEGYKLFW
jgi:hypothetical protein